MSYFTEIDQKQRVMNADIASVLAGSEFLARFEEPCIDQTITSVSYTDTHPEISVRDNGNVLPGILARVYERVLTSGPHSREDIDPHSYKFQHASGSLALNHALVGSQTFAQTLTRVGVIDTLVVNSFANPDGTIQVDDAVVAFPEVTDLFIRYEKVSPHDGEAIRTLTGDATTYYKARCAKIGARLVKVATEKIQSSLTNEDRQPNSQSIHRLYLPVGDDSYDNEPVLDTEQVSGVLMLLESDERDAHENQFRTLLTELDTVKFTTQAKLEANQWLEQQKVAHPGLFENKDTEAQISAKVLEQLDIATHDKIEASSRYLVKAATLYEGVESRMPSIISQDAVRMFLTNPSVTSNIVAFDPKNGLSTYDINGECLVTLVPCDHAPAYYWVKIQYMDTQNMKDIHAIRRKRANQVLSSK